MDKNKQLPILREFMANITPDKTVFIGASSGYLFIGNLERYRADFPKLEKEADNALKENTKNLNKLIREINKNIDMENEALDGVLMTKISNDLLAAKKKLTERDVIESYEKVLSGEESGIAVIIKGAEHGKFWFKREYDKKQIQEDEEG